MLVQLHVVKLSPIRIASTAIAIQLVLFGRYRLAAGSSNGGSEGGGTVVVCAAGDGEGGSAETTEVDVEEAVAHFEGERVLWLSVGIGVKFVCSECAR